MTISVTKPKHIDSIELHKINIIHSESPCVRADCQYYCIVAENSCTKYEAKSNTCPMYITNVTKEV